MNRQQKWSYLIIILFIGTIVMASADYSHTIKTVTIEDQQNNSQTASTKPVGQVSALGTDLAGDIDNPIPITFANGTGDVDRNGTVSSQLDGSQEFPELWYSFDITQTAPFLIRLSTSLSVDVFQFSFDIFAASNMEYIASSPLEGNPLEFDFFSDGAKSFVIGVFGYDVNFDDSFDFYSGEKAPFTLNVFQYKAGPPPNAGETKLFGSQALMQMQSILSYYGKSGYINGTDQIELRRQDSLGLPLSDPSLYFDSNDQGFYKGVALSIFGLMRTAQMLSSSSAFPQLSKDDIFLRFLGYAMDLYTTASAGGNILIVGNERYYIRPSEPANTAYLEDQAYMMFAMGEMLYEAGKMDFSIGFNRLYNIPPALNATLNQMADDYILLANTIDDRFEYSGTNGRFFERLSDIGNSYVRNNEAYLESNAIVLEGFNWVSLGTSNWDTTAIANTYPSVDIATDLGSYIITDNAVTNKDMMADPVNNVGIGREWIAVDNSTKSNSSTLTGNLAYLMHQANEASVTAAFDPSLVTQTSDFYQNILRFFEVPDTGLLYSQVNIVDSPTNQIQAKTISTLDNALAILLSQRLENAWNQASATDKSRSWGKKALDHFNHLYNLMWDDLDGAFFANYDNEANYFVSNENAVESNRFIANAFILTYLARLFPVETGITFDNNIPVETSGNIALEFSQILLTDSLQWFDFIVPFEFQLSISIPKFDITIKDTIQMSDFFNLDFESGSLGDSKFVSYSYEPQTRGSYEITIQLSREGSILFSQTVELTALGQASVEFALPQFELTDTTYTTDISYVDETGSILSGLQVRGSLGLTRTESQPLFGAKYSRTVRTDSSGKLEMTFNTADLDKDGLLNTTEIFSRTPTPQFVNLPLYLNVTNNDNFNLEKSYIVVNVQVRLTRVNLRTSPSTLQITQGTTDSYSFTVSALDQDQSPISNAKVDYSFPVIPSIANTVYTDADGEATITLRDSDLFALSDLAILRNRDKQDNVEVNTTILLSISAENYPSKTVARTLSILPNDLIITANPVQVEITEKNILQSSVSPIEIEVATADLFTRVVNALAHIAWADPAWNDYVDLSVPEQHVTPYTFQLDPSKLPAGKFTILIVAEADGITSSVAIQSIVNDGKGLDLSQDQIRVPVIVPKTIFVKQSTVQDVAFTALSVLGALVIAKGGGIVGSILSEKILKRECPHCGEPLNRRTDATVCRFCGKDIPWSKQATSNKAVTSAEDSSSNLGNSSDISSEIPEK